MNVLESHDIDCQEYFEEIPLHEVEEESGNDSSSDSEDSDEECGGQRNVGLILSRLF